MRGAPLTRREALARFGAWLAASPLCAAQQTPGASGEPPGRIAPIDELVNVFEIEAMAERMLDIATYAKIAGSPRGGFERITFRPRLMVNTEKLDMSIELFGEKLFAPILAGPASHQTRFHPEGELAMARGASAARAAMVVSSRSSFPVEKIAAETAAPFWYQVYPEPDAGATAAKIRQAVQAGCKAVCVTVGTPYQPARSDGYPSPGTMKAMGNPALDWAYVARLRQQTPVPLVLKGIMSASEARTALENGIGGIVVSNHGGRFLEGLADPIAVLPGIADAVNGSAPILIDGGIRRGSDVLKALALGANAVLLARPALWGLAAYGAAGVQTALELMRTELARDMAMCGTVNIAAITREFVKIHRR